MSDEINAVREFWRLRNGKIAEITQRSGGIAVGHIHGTDQTYTWLWGRTCVQGYDFREQLPEPEPRDARKGGSDAI